MRANAGTMQAGDAYAVNDPYHGGTHLPDITVITPVFEAAGHHILFYVGSRGHHADVGGITPGSMPPHSTTVDDEGVLLTNWKLVERGRLHEAEILERLTSGPWPARNPQQNLADLRAQIAANEKGVQELTRMVDHCGLDVVHAYMQHVQDNAEDAVRRVITALNDGAFRYTLDNGAVIQVAVCMDRDRREATIDFTGTSAQLPSNFNAPAAITTAAVLYVFRTLVTDEIPLNAGCLKPLHLLIPPRSMLNPQPPAAVVAGNVETSQCIVNTLYGALGVVAASQCTMNNVTFGNAQYQYYETLAGGSGAGPGFDGTAVVQTHMTNSRLTDPEVLEWRFPVRLESYTIRAGSGGRGQWTGGDGGTRRLRFLAPMTASILSNNRGQGAFGMAGGPPGAPGRTWVERVDGTCVVLTSCDTAAMQPGDMLVIETPGGGGYGPCPTFRGHVHRNNSGGSIMTSRTRQSPGPARPGEGVFRHTTNRVVLPDGRALMLAEDVMERFAQLQALPPPSIRAVIEQGAWHGPTSGLGGDAVQANLVFLPEEIAEEFRAYARLNPAPIPVLEVLPPGDPISRKMAPGADLRTMAPGYRVYEDGRCTAELPDVRGVHYHGMRCFLIGCSFSFEQALAEAGLTPHHMAAGKNVPMYEAPGMPTIAYGRFQGPLVLSMRAYQPEDIRRVVDITQPYERVHGAPVFIGTREDVGVYRIPQGDPKDIGIDITTPQYGDLPVIKDGEVCVFWACGVTPQAALQHANPTVPIAYSHAPGMMFITDMRNAARSISRSL
jgi:N-methylhydantoinase B/oxoprolinase/acetone carboxylase alpha subunit/uncharacterized protein YcsI (UPF0317 family)